MKPTGLAILFLILTTATTAVAQRTKDPQPNPYSERFCSAYEADDARASDAFCAGYQAGYDAGWCRATLQKDGGCLQPHREASCPTRRSRSHGCPEGYQRGYADGQQEADRRVN